MVNEFSVTPFGANLGQAFAPMAQAYGMKQQGQGQADKLAAQKQIYGGYMDALSSGDFEAQRQIERDNPILMEQLGSIRQGQDSRSSKLESDMANDVLLGGMDGAGLVEKYGAELQSMGMGELGAQLASASPEQLKELAVQNADPESYKRYRDSLEGGQGDLPAEAVAFNEIIKDFTPEQQKAAKLVKAGLKGRAMSNALLSAIESGSITNLADAKAEIKQAEKFGEMTATSRAKTIDRGFEGIVKIDGGIRNIDKAIAVLDRGAGVGAIEKFWPSIKAASVELDNIRGQMALDVVGATTFGALSKGELDLAKDIALPTGLDSEELKDYLTRKKVAQEKLRAYYYEQIQFLDQGGTVAGFLRMKEAGQSTDTQPEQGPSDEELLNKYL